MPKINAGARTTVYRIRYHVTGHPDIPLTTQVSIIDGYSTLADAPKIIAIAKFGGDVKMAKRIIVDSATVVRTV